MQDWYNQTTEAYPISRCEPAQSEKDKSGLKTSREKGNLDTNV